MIDSGPVSNAQESWSLYILNPLGELQRRVNGFRDRKAAMSGAGVLLAKWAGCVALVVHVEGGAWTACHVYSRRQCERMLPASLRHRRPHFASVDVHNIRPRPAMAGV